MRKLKTALETNLPSLSNARLKELTEVAVVDAYTEEEQAVGFLTMIEEHLASVAVHREDPGRRR
ncbi:MAG TPA: hypothetical protein VGF61_04130 [Candidatus Acidoferrum sp.]|jgi:hypothetical protein